VEGTPFGRYRLVELLGRGGMGEVWRAHDNDTDRIVAIKVLPAHLSEDEEFQRRFRREAHAAARLNNPHIIPIHNYGEIDGRLYVDMRLIEGRDLGTVLADGPLLPAQAVHIVEQVAMALHAAHQVGLLHRDIKPSNILLDRDDFAYLIDFGISRALDETRMTKSGFMIGTFQYIAPERLDSEIEEDARADIYSLACVLYESLTGQPPFPGDTMARLVAAHLSTPPPRPSTTQPNVPPQVDEVIATGMAKDPDERYATTIELADAARYAITVPIHRSTPSPAFLAATEPVRNRAAAQRSLAAPPQGGSPASQPQPTDRPRPEAVSTTWWRQRRPALIAGAIVVAVVLLVAGFIIFRPQQPLRPPAPSAAPSTQPVPPPPPPPPKPVEEAALEGLLLSPDQLDTAMGVTGMRALPTKTVMWDDSGYVLDKACLPLLEGPAEAAVYAGSGWSAVRGQGVGTHHGQSIRQYVVLFSSARDAGAFFTASAQSWAGCSNRQFTVNDPGQPGQRFTVGPVSNTNGTLSASTTGIKIADTTLTCQRALTVANNVAIDIKACNDQSDVAAAATIAHQIAAKVPTTW
jgi:serine/threonine protein kinase